MAGAACYALRMPYDGYGQFCPVALTAAILTERWTPLVVRELLSGSTRFNELQRGVPRMSSALLSRRLKDLEAAGIIVREKTESGVQYRLTTAGKELRPIIEHMGLWSQRWLRQKLVADDNLDPDLLMWDIRRTVSPGKVTHKARFVVQFEFPDAPKDHRRYWLVYDDGVADLCVRDPGFDVDVFVRTRLRVMTEVWLGHVDMDAAIRQDRLTLEGARRDITAFRASFTLGVFAPAGRAPVPKSSVSERQP